MADFGRITGVTAEPAITVPTGDALGRITGVGAEVAITTPDDLARVSGVLGEVAVTEVGQELRVAFVYAEVFSKDPGIVRAPRDTTSGGGTRGRLSSIRRR